MSTGRASCVAHLTGTRGGAEITNVIELLTPTTRIAPAITAAMRYVMREKILSWGDDFTIKDADGRNAYKVDGKVFSFGDKLSFQDMQGRELARIEQKLLSLGPQYEIIRGDATVAVVKKHLFTLLRARFTVD